jgi:Na+/phosphate symporter
MKKDTPIDLARDAGKEFPALIASMPASARQRRIAFGVLIFLSIAFAIVMPFARTQPGRLDAFIPVIQTVLCFADVITGVFCLLNILFSLIAPFWLSQAAISSAACLRFCRRLTFRVHIARQAF